MNIDREGQQEKQLLRNVISHERSQSFMINGLKKKTRTSKSSFRQQTYRKSSQILLL